MLRIVLWGAMLFASGAGQLLAQGSMGLRDVVDQAVAQSLAVNNAELNLLSSRVDLRQNELARYPSLSAQGNAGYQFGLNIDPTTNTLRQQALGFMSYSLDAGLNLYRGGLIRRSIAQNRASIAASEASVQAAKQDVALQAAQYYLEALLAGEERAAAESRVAQANAQLRRVEGLIAGGQLAPVERFEVDAQVARQEQTVLAASNAQAFARLRLSQLLRLPAGTEINLAESEAFDLDAVVLEEITVAELYASARERQPNIKAAKLSADASELGVAVARSRFLPTVSAFGQLNTRYSTQAPKFTPNGTFDYVSQPVRINGVDALLGFPQAGGDAGRKPAGDQFRDFFGQSVGLSVRVPIFSNGQNQSALERAQLTVKQAELRVTQAELDLEIQVGQALQAAQNARAEVAASRRALAAAQASYDAADRRSALGAASSYDLTNAQILLEQAQVALLRARYQYVFNAKVVDFYLGRSLTLD